MSNEVETEEALVEARFLEIQKSLDNRDETALKLLFSEYVLNKADVDGGIEYVFRVFSGKSVSYEGGLWASHEEKHDGLQGKWLQGDYSVTTETGVFDVFFADQVESDDDSTRVGLYSLQVRLTSTEKLAPIRTKMFSTIGIFIPES
jgi:hypothetical protein